MSRYVPGRGFEPDPRGVDRNDPAAMADYERRKEEFYSKPTQERPRLSDNPNYDRSKGRYGGLKSPGPKRPNWSRPGMSRLEKRDEKREWGKSRPGEMYIQIEGPGNPSWEQRNPLPQKDYSPMMTDKERARAGGRDLITRPTVDLVEEAKRQGTYRDDPSFLRGERDYDVDLGKWEPMSRRPVPGKGLLPPPDRGGRGGRDYDVDLGRWEPMSRRPVPDRGGRRGGWWNEPRRPEPRREYPTELSDRLSSDTERIRLLTGESDLRKGPLQDNYDPVDIDFNRQFNEAPRGRQPWHSDPTGNPLERDPLSDYDVREGRFRRSPKPPGPPKSPEQIRLIEEKKAKKYQPRKPKRNIKNRR